MLALRLPAGPVVWHQRWRIHPRFPHERILEPLVRKVRVLCDNELEPRHHDLRVFTREKPDTSCASCPIESVSDFVIRNVERLIYEDAEVYSESGIVLKGEFAQEVIIAAGKAPGSVSIAAPFAIGDFNPEFANDQYQRRLA